jgi:hypothetical protein
MKLPTRAIVIAARSVLQSSYSLALEKYTAKSSTVVLLSLMQLDVLRIGAWPELDLPLLFRPHLRSCLVHCLSLDFSYTKALYFMRTKQIPY